MAIRLWRKRRVVGQRGHRHGRRERQGWKGGRWPFPRQFLVRVGRWATKDTRKGPHIHAAPPLSLQLPACSGERQGWLGEDVGHLTGAFRSEAQRRMTTLKSCQTFYRIVQVL